MITKVHTLREMTRGELQQRLRDLQDEQFNLNMRKSLKGLENPLRLRYVGRDIAKVRTVLREDERGLRRLAESKTSILSEAATKKANKE